MNRLVSNMLELSELESGRIGLNPEIFSIQRLVRYIIKKFSRQAAKKIIQVKLLQPEDEYLVKADSFRIEQVLSNLLTNAIRHTPNNGEIIINLREGEEKIWLSVQNNGPAISEQELKKIWGKFYRVEKITQQKTGRQRSGAIDCQKYT